MHERADAPLADRQREAAALVNRAPCAEPGAAAAWLAAVLLKGVADAQCGVPRVAADVS